MRNSLMPLLGVLLVGILAVLAIPRDREIGQDGPQLSPGILRLPKDMRKIVPSSPLRAEQAVEVVRAAPRVPGLEPDAWRVVAVVAGDAQPMTKAAVLGLSERLTERGSVAVVVDAAKAPLPLAADRVLTITTSNAVIPAEPGGASSVTVLVRQEAVVLPAQHPAAGLQGATGVPETEFRIKHQSQGEGERPRWASWYAGVGRSIGDAIIGHLAGGVVPAEWDRDRPPPIRPEAGSWTLREPKALLFLLTVPVFLILRSWMLSRLPPDHPQRTRRLRWIRPIALSAAIIIGAIWTAKPQQVTVEEVAVDPLTTWTTHLPIAPSLEVLRWRGCFSDDLVRGWVGRIGGTVATAARSGETIPADKPVLDLLGKYDADATHQEADRWRPQPDPAPGQRVWQREKNNSEELFMLASDPKGFDCVLWQEQSRAASVHARWIECASDPALARAARRLLRRHLLCPRIPDDQQAEAAAVLRRDPDAAEVAMLAERPDATDGEKAFAMAARYAYGREAAPPASDAPTWTRLERGRSVTVDDRPTLVQTGDTYVLVLSRPGGGGEIVARGPAGAWRGPITEAGTATLTLADGAIELGAGRTLTWR